MEQNTCLEHVVEATFCDSWTYNVPSENSLNFLRNFDEFFPLIMKSSLRHLNEAVAKRLVTFCALQVTNIS